MSQKIRKDILDKLESMRTLERTAGGLISDDEDDPNVRMLDADVEEKGDNANFELGRSFDTSILKESTDSETKSSSSLETTRSSIVPSPVKMSSGSDVISNELRGIYYRLIDGKSSEYARGALDALVAVQNEILSAYKRNLATQSKQDVLIEKVNQMARELSEMRYAQASAYQSVAANPVIKGETKPSRSNTDKRAEVIVIRRDKMTPEERVEPSNEVRRTIDERKAPTMDTKKNDALEGNQLETPIEHPIVASLQRWQTPENTLACLKYSLKHDWIPIRMIDALKKSTDLISRKRALATICTQLKNEGRITDKIRSVMMTELREWDDDGPNQPSTSGVKY